MSKNYYLISKLVSNAFEEEGIRLRILSVIQMKNDHKQYIEYKRTKKSILEIFANIGSLFYTIYSAFTFIFRLILLYFDIILSFSKSII